MQRRSQRQILTEDVDGDVAFFSDVLAVRSRNSFSYSVLPDFPLISAETLPIRICFHNRGCIFGTVTISDRSENRYDEREHDMSKVGVCGYVCHE